MDPEKKLVEEVSGWLRVYDDGSVDRTWTGPLEVKFVTEPVPPHEEFVDGVAVRDVIINEESGLKARIYLPEKKQDENDKLPVLLHFHGGGFCISQPDWYMYYRAYTCLVRSARVICVSVFFRFAPEHRLPAAIEDGYTALLWLHSLARGESDEPWLKAGADFNRVFLIGDSVGGNVVHELATRAGKMELTPLRLAGGILIHPGFLRSERSKSELEQPQTPFLTLDMVDKFMSLSLPVGATKDHPITCPMGSEAPPLEGLNLPPFLVCIAEGDLIKDTEMEYYEAMKKANKDVELLLSHGVIHSFYLNVVAVDTDPVTAAETADLIARIKEFIKTH